MKEETRLIIYMLVAYVVMGYCLLHFIVLPHMKTHPVVHATTTYST